MGFWDWINKNNNDDDDDEYEEELNDYSDDDEYEEYNETALSILKESRNYFVKNKSKITSDLKILYETESFENFWEELNNMIESENCFSEGIYEISDYFYKIFNVELFPLEFILNTSFSSILEISKCYQVEKINIKYDQFFDKYFLFIHYYKNKFDYNSEIITTQMILSSYDFDVLNHIANIIDGWLCSGEFDNINKKDFKNYDSSKNINYIFEQIKNDINTTDYLFSKFDDYDFDISCLDQFDDDENNTWETRNGTKEKKPSNSDSKNSDKDTSDKPNNQSPSSNKNQEIIKKNKKGILLDDIAGLDEAKKAFKEKVILPITHAHIYKQFNKKTGGGILLYGLPGTGKTMFAEAVSNEIDAKFFSLKCSDIKSKWIGESEERIKKLFNNARKEKRAIIFFDEFEAIGRKRSGNEDVYDAANDIVPEILAQMQGVGNDTSNILIIAATNRPWDIDSALLRPGRFDVKIHIPLPDFDARKKIFDIKLKETPNDNLNTNYLAEITDGCNGADVADFVERLKMEAIHRSIKENKPLPINNDDVKNVLKTFKSSVISDDISKLKTFEFNK